MPAPDLTPDERQTFDPYRLLPHDATRNGLVDAWQASEQTDAHLLAYCILKDPTYASMWDRLRHPDGPGLSCAAALGALVKAGLIAEYHDPRLGLWRHDRPHLPRLNSPGMDDAVVVVLPGVFDPFHVGHGNAIESAYRHLTATGVKVAACIAAPCHDRYASVKRGDWTPASERISSIHRVNVDVPRLLVSEVETSAVCPLNFTTVLDAIADDTGLRTVMVFGADNAGFAAAFPSADEWVCVVRPGHEASVPAGVMAVGTGIAQSSTQLRALSAAAAG